MKNNLYNKNVNYFKMLVNNYRKQTIGKNFNRCIEYKQLKTKIIVKNNYHKFYITIPKNLTGKYIEYSYNNTIYKHFNYLNGKLHGEQILYDYYGNIQRIENYKNGILHGQRIIYYLNGNIDTIYNFKNGVVDGLILVYNGDNKLISRHNIAQNKLDGLCIKYDCDEFLVIKNSYFNGIPNNITKITKYSKKTNIIMSRAIVNEFYKHNYHINHCKYYTNRYIILKKRTCYYKNKKFYFF